MGARIGLGVCLAVAWHSHRSSARSIRLAVPICLLPAIARLLEAETGETVLVPPHPQLMGAYGAALLALAKIGEPAGKA